MSEHITKVIDLVPGDTEGIETVRVSDLTEETFWYRYVCTHTPLLIKGAVADWPACRSWSEPGYLEERSADVMVQLERSFNANPPLGSARGERRLLSDAISEIRLAFDDQTFSIPAMAVPQAWLADVGYHRFMGGRFRKPLGYPGKRIFFYKNASTEWHYHQIDETLTSQLVGAKRVSMFRLNRKNWRRFALPIKANFHHMDCRDKFFPSDFRLTKLEGVIEAGDAIYIPPFWWHGIDAETSAPGITLAECFRSPLRRFGAWSEPGTRELLADAMRYSKLRMPPLLALILFSSASRALGKERWLDVR